MLKNRNVTISDTFDGQTIFKKKASFHQNVRNAISDTFDGQTIFGKKTSCHQKRSERDFGYF